MYFKTYRLIFTFVFFLLFTINLFAQLHWLPQPSGTTNILSSITFFDSLTGIAVGNSGTILRTTDGGYQWTSPLEGEPVPTYVGLSDIETIDSNSAIIVGSRSAIENIIPVGYKTYDKGLHWDSSGIGGTNVSFADEENGIVFQFFNDWIMGIFIAYDVRTTDGGTTWRLYHSVIDGKEINKIIINSAFVDTNFCVAISEDGCVFRWLRDSSNLSYWNLLDSVSSKIYGIHFLDTSVGFLSGASGMIYKTTDGGQSWQTQTSGTGNKLTSIYFLSANEGYIAGNGGTILHTTDGGTNWSLMPSGTTRNLWKIYFKNPNHGWAVGESGTILKYGLFAKCNLSRTEIDFGDVVDTTTKSLSVIVNNPGLDTLIISNIISDNTEFSATPHNLNIPPAVSDSFSVLFSPVGGGIRNGRIVILHNADSPPDTITVEGTALDYNTTVVTVNAKWNLVSNPQLTENDSTHILFPTAMSKTYRYDQSSGYQESPRIENGSGYWIKFNSYEEFNIAGVVNILDTIEVKEGWNLIGSISKPVATVGIIQIPENIVESEYFSFDDGYKIADMIIPGKAYWVKVNMNGKLILLSP
jgi:photosystem II stability/assembly factor-like uncharacterized protein